MCELMTIAAALVCTALYFIGKNFYMLRIYTRCNYEIISQN